MEEHKHMITFKGEPLTLEGNLVREGDQAPDFTVVDNDLEEKKLSDYEGKICVLVAVPSLDTGVCDAEARRFNKEAENFSDDVEVLTISMDLPFAQARWCGQADAKNVTTLSDHKAADFGEKYGVLIKELRLLSRTIFIVDKDRKVVYKQLVKEVTDEPDYDQVLESLNKLI